MEGVIAIIAIVLGYKLISEFFAGRKEIKLAKFRAMGSTASHEPYQENPSELGARAADLKRRLATLEEIIASERRS